MSTALPDQAPEYRSFEDEDRSLLSERLRVVLLTLLAACPVMIGVGLWMSNPQTLWTALTGVVVSAIAYALNRAGRVDGAVLLLLMGMLVAATATMSAGESVHDSGMVLYPTIVVLGGLLLKPRTNLLLVANVIASVALVWWLGWMGHAAPEFRHLTDYADLFAIVAVLVVEAVAVNVLARGLHRSLREARRENVERRAAEAEVRRLNADLEKRVETRTAELAAANEDLESFSYSVSHDLRTPLRVASNYAGILDQEFASEWDPAARQLLERIVASNSRMNVLIDELLRFSRLGRKQIVKQRVDMHAVAQRVVDLIQAGSIDRHVDWQVGSMPEASADPVLIEQVFSNLVGNALKYSSKQDRPRIELGFDDDGGQPSYFVSDNGVGFPMSQADRLFGVFERLHREDEFEGNGIGLATVHRILTKHGGRIWADSDVGDGATFRFQLPDDENQLGNPR